jgi:hypothetical protein
MTINDIIENKDNDLSSIVEVRGMNPFDDCSPLTELYFHGTLSDVPNSLLQCEVLSVGWLHGANCFCISIPFKV